jgi:hypothetical protein
MRLLKSLEQKGVGRIEGVPAVVRRVYYKAFMPNSLRKIALSNCRFKVKPKN